MPFVKGSWIPDAEANEVVQPRAELAPQKELSSFQDFHRLQDLGVTKLAVNLMGWPLTDS